MPPHALIVNDDGPPSATSPYVLDLYQKLVARGLNVRVVLPSSQKSWSGTNYSVTSSRVRYWYYYPLRDNFLGTHPDTHLCWSHVRRKINTERGEIGEWVLVDGVPSTCTNIGLYTGEALLGGDAGPIDLVLSGPNFGRNTGTAFSISSGTLGGALSGSLCDVRSIAISFCHFMQDPPTLDKSRASGPALAPDAFDAMARLACEHTARLCEKLYDAWDTDTNVESYSINVPIAETLTQPSVYWTRIWSSRHEQLYPLPSDRDNEERVKPLGIDPKEPVDEDPACSYLAFRPNLSRAMCPSDPQPGTDAWAIHHGYISISRLVARFEHVEPGTRPPPQL